MAKKIDIDKLANDLGFSKKQLKLIMTVAYGSEEDVIVDGAVRAGKTYCGLKGFALRLKHNLENPLGVKDEFKNAVLAYNYELARDNLLQELMYELIHEGIAVQLINNEITIRRGSKYYNREFSVKAYGATNKRAYKSFQGKTFRNLFLDEAPLFDKDAMRVIKARTHTFRATGESVTVKTSNPVGNEESEYFVENIKGNKNAFIFQMYDNPIIPKEYIDKLKEKMPKDLFDREVLGKWIASQGAIYTQLPIKISQEDLPTQFDYITIGLDEGRVDATTCVAFGFLKSTSCYYIIDQYYHKNDSSVHKTLLDTHIEIRDWLNKLALKYSTTRVLKLFCETSPGYMYDVLRQDLLLNPLYDVKRVNKAFEEHKSHSSIMEGIENFQMLIGMNKLYVNQECKQIWSYFVNAVYDKTGRQLDDGTFDVDSGDAGRYGIKVDHKYIRNDFYETMKGAI